MLPAAFALFTRVAHRTACGQRWARCATVLALMVPGMTFLHPNTFFTLRTAAGALDHSQHPLPRHRARGQAAPAQSPHRAHLRGACRLLVWNELATSSALRPITEVQWAPFATMPQSLISVLTLSYLNPFHPMAPEARAGALVLIGFVRLLREQADRWLCGSYGLAVVLVLAAQHWTAPREVLTGFWYNDPARISAMAAIPAVALLAIGLDRTRACGSLAWPSVGAAGAVRGPHAATPIACGAALSVAFVAPHLLAGRRPALRQVPQHTRERRPPLRCAGHRPPRRDHRDPHGHLSRCARAQIPHRRHHQPRGDRLPPGRCAPSWEPTWSSTTPPTAAHRSMASLASRCLYRYFDGFYKYEQSHEPGHPLSARSSGRRPLRAGGGCHDGRTLRPHPRP